MYRPPPPGFMPPGGLPPPYMGRPMGPPMHMQGMMPMQKIMEEPLLPKNPTLYLQNLNERVKLPDLKNALYQLFSNYGEVVEVHAKTNIRMRGQAFVIYQDEESAEAALQALRGYVFFGKPMRVNFSKKESDVIAKMRGTFEESDTAKREQRRVKELKEKSIKAKKKQIDKLMKLRVDNDIATGGGTRRTGVAFGEQQSNTKLLVEGLSKTTPTQVLQNLFESSPGFKDVNHIIQKSVAFIEFDSEEFAGAAMMALNGYAFKDPSNGEQLQLRIQYMRR